MRVVSARVIQYFGSRYQSVAAAAEAEKVWEYTTKIGGRGRSESDADVCMRNWLSGMVSAALGQFPCPTRKDIAPSLSVLEKQGHPHPSRKI